MKIIITGGAGFIGSHLCDVLLKEKKHVIVLDNLLTGRIDNIEHHLKNERFKFIKHNVTDDFYTTKKIDVIFHFASPASPTDYLKFPIQTLKVGALGTYKMLGLAKEKKAKFILASTSEVYGDPLMNPQPEVYWGNVNPIGPRGVYDEAKRYAEALTMAYHRVHGVDTKIVRIFNTYGPRMRVNDGRAIPTFIRQAKRNQAITIFGDGTQTRSFCHVKDTVKGILKVSKSSFNLPVNIGNPQEITLKELADKIIKIGKSKSRLIYKPLPVDDPKVRNPDIRLAQTFGWEPQISLDQGLKELLNGN